MINSFSSQKNYFKNKSVALVGPSPHLEGKSLGKLIDKYDSVWMNLYENLYFKKTSKIMEKCLM